jgi:SAM-dependent methyltransferase
VTQSSHPGFCSRSCPHCGAQEHELLLSLARDDMFRSNWSYRQDAAQLLPVEGTRAFPIRECRACGFIYAGLLPDPAFLHTVYDQVIDADAARANNLSPRNFAAKMNYLSTLFKLLPEKPVLRVLDYGCGFGPVLQLLSAMPGVHGFGFDSSEARVHDLRARGLLASNRVKDVESQGPFDAVILDNVLEHLASPRDGLAFIQGVCDTGAVIFVSVPGISRDTLLDQRRVVATRGVIPMDINPWEHLNYFDVAHLDQLFAEFGFTACCSASLPVPVDVGLRPSPSTSARVKNSVASVRRLAAYAATGDVLSSVTARFYQRSTAERH